MCVFFKYIYIYMYIFFVGKVGKRLVSLQAQYLQGSLKVGNDGESGEKKWGKNGGNIKIYKILLNILTFFSLLI